jgi:hemerythrin-like domain-containing protein
MAARKQASKRKSSSTTKSKSRKTTSSRKASRQPSDALALLRADHQRVQEMFDQFEKTRSEDRKGTLAQQICQELTVHAQIEEEIFYPAAREAIKEEDLIDEATVEHQSAKDLIAQIESGGPSGELFEAKVKVLGEYIKHHVKEEQNELFPQVRKTKLDLKELGQRLQERKMELMEASTSAAAPSGFSGSRRTNQAAKTAARRDDEGIVARMARGIGLDRT